MKKFRSSLLTALLLALFGLLAIVASSGAYADGLLTTSGKGIGYGIDVPVYSSQPSEQIATGELQFQAIYEEKVVWQYDAQMGEYAGTFPTGVGVCLKAYPNILTRNLAVEAVAAGEAELAKKLETVYDKRSKQFGFKPMDGLTTLYRQADGRYALEIPLLKGTDIHCIRFYVLVRDAKRTDQTVLLFFHWASKKPGAGLVNTLRFATEAWDEKFPAPSGKYLTELLARAGNGGNGRIFARLVEADSAKKEPLQDDEARRVAADAIDGADLADAKAEEARRGANDAGSKNVQQDKRLDQLEAVAENHANQLDALGKNQIIHEQAIQALDKRLRVVETAKIVQPQSVAIGIKVSNVNDDWCYQFQDAKGEGPVRGPFNIMRFNMANFMVSDNGSFRFRVLDCKSQQWGEWSTICIAPAMGMLNYAFPGGVR